MSGFSLRPTVFHSKAERELFRALKSRWSPSYGVYPQLPLSNLFGDPPTDASEVEQRFFRASSVDYTLCDLHDAPILSVEFDGVGGGYSLGGKYLQSRDVANDSYRKTKLEYKLGLAARLEFPFFVVSDEEARPIEAGETLTIVDGIIGSALTRRRERELIAEMVADKEARQGYIDDIDAETIAVDAGTLAELEVDPFEPWVSKIEFDLQQHHHVLDMLRVEEYEKPPAPAPQGEWMSSEYLNSVLRRHAALEAARAHGARVVLKLKGDYPVITRNICLRAVGDWFTASSLSTRIAKYLALKHAHRLVAANQDIRPDTCYLELLRSRA